MGIQLRAYDENGTVLGFLPDYTDLKEQQSHNDVGTLTFRYPLDGVNAAWLGRDTLYLSKLEDGVEGIERYLYEDDSDDDADVQGDGRLMTVAARGTLALLEQAVVYPKGHTAGGSVNGLVAEYDFTNATPGTILKTLIDKAKARGCFPNLTYDFTATTDSAGQAWAKTHTVKYTAGMDLLKLVASMCDNGWADVRAEGFKIRLYNPDAAVGGDLPGVILRLGQQVTAGPRKRTRRGILSHMLGAGSTEKNTNVELSNATTLSRYGRREGFASDGRITDYTELSQTVSYQLKQRETMREGFTLSVALQPTRDEVWPIPGQDFKVGERIRYDRRRTSATEFEPLRVRTMSWDYGNGKSAPSCSIELNDMFVEAGIRLARRIAGIVNGSTTEAPPAPPPPVKDTTVPAAPASVSVDPVTLLVEGKYVGQATVTWPGVTTNTDSTPVDDFAHYLVAHRVNGGTWTASRVSDDTTDWIGNLTPLSTLEVRVAAADTNGHISAWTVSAAVTVPLDDVPPAQPSVPILTTRLGTVTCRWDGKDLNGAVMASDFSYVEVQSSEDSAFATYTVVGRLEQPDASLVVTTQAYGTPVFYRFFAVDAAGNRSIASASASITTAQTFNSDLAQEVVNKIDQAEINAKNYADTTYSGTKSTVNSWTFTGKTTINGGQIEADTISAIALRAHIVGADQLVVGGVMNQVPNGVGEWGSLGGFFADPTTGLSFETVDKPAEVSGVVKCAAGTFSKAAQTNYWDVEPGSEWLVEVWLKADLPNSRIYVELRDQDGNHAATYAAVAGTNYGGGATYPIENLVVPTAWTKYTAVATAKSTTRKMRVGTVYFNHSNGTERNAVQSVAIRVRGRGTGLLLVDGSIMAKHMAANSVTADAIDAGAIKTEHLQLGVLRTNLIGDPSFEESYAITARVTGTATNHFQWRFYSAVSTSVTRQRGKSRSGSWALDLYCDVAAVSATAYSPSFQVTGGKTYKLRVPAVSVGAQAVIAVDVFSGTTPETVSTNNPVTLDVIEPLSSVPQAAAIPIQPGEYGEYVAEFTPAADQWCMVRIRNSNPAGQSSLCLDDVSVIEKGAGGASEFTAAGLRLFDDDGDEVGAFVTNRPSYFSVTKNGSIVASVDEAGAGSFTELSSEGDPVVGGLPLLGNTLNFDSPTEQHISGHLDKLPRGVVGYNAGGTGSFSGTGWREELSFLAEPGRSYKVTFSGAKMVWSSGNAIGGFYLGYSTPSAPGGDAAGNGATTYAYPYCQPVSAAGQTSAPSYVKILRANPGGTGVGGELNYGRNRILVGLYCPVAITLSEWSITVEDIGPDVPDTGVLNTSGTSSSAATQTYTTTWQCNSSEAYTGAGGAETWTTDLVQGYYSSANGNQKSCLLFTGNGVSGQAVTVATAMSGATVVKAEVYLYFKHWYYTSGGTAVIRAHNYTALSATTPGGSAVNSSGWSAGAGRWVDITSIWNPSMRGVFLGPGASNSLTYYGKAASHADSSGKPLLRLTYRK